MPDLKAIEARIWSLLEPGTIYGMPSLGWPGAKECDYFAHDGLNIPGADLTDGSLAC